MAEESDQSPVNLSKGDEEKSPVNLSEGDEEKLPVNLSKGDEESSPVNLSEGDEEKLPVNLSEGDAEKSPVKIVKKPSAKKKDAIPNVLRASTGSCHDACKFGKPQEFKDKPWRPLRRRVSAPVPDAEKAVDVQIFVDKKIKDAVTANKDLLTAKKILAPEEGLKKRTPSVRRSPVHDSSKLPKKVVTSFTKSPSPEPHKTMKKVLRSPEKSPSPNLFKSLPHKTMNFVRSPAKSPSPNLLNSLPHKTMMNFVRSPEKSPSPDLMKSLPRKPVKKVVRSSEKMPSPDLLKPPKREVASADKIDIASKRASSNAKPRSASAGPRKMSVVTVKPSSSPDWCSDYTSSSNLKTSRVPVKKVVVSPATTLSSKKTPKVEVIKILDPSGVITASIAARKNKGVKDQTQRNIAPSGQKKLTGSSKTKEIVDEKVEEKTLHMIDTRKDCSPAAQNESQLIQSPSPLSPESLALSSQTNSQSFTSNGVDAEESTDSEAETSVSSYDVTGNANGRKEDDQDPANMKLKFRRGKVVDLQCETNSSRKLRFRHGRSLEDDQSVSGGTRRSYRNKVVGTEKKETKGGPVKVVLKHQEVVSKEEQVLFNNVIKETASKLVETRKSKVKALVGAFETVISLQEKKPSAAVSR